MSTAATNQPGEVPEFQLHHRLALALEHADVSVAEMAEVIGYSARQTGNYLAGRQVPRNGTLRVWAMRCGVPYAWIATGSLPGETPDGTPGMGNITDTGWDAETPGGEVIQLHRPTPTTDDEERAA